MYFSLHFQTKDTLWVATILVALAEEILKLFYSVDEILRHQISSFQIMMDLLSKQKVYAS